MTSASAHARIDLLDVLRGFALFGILITHIIDFSGYTFALDYAPDVVYAGAFDVEISTAVHLLINGKFYSLFALLFGIGFALQYRSANARLTPFASMYRRRMSFLLAIGALHGLLVWYGDILFYYSLLGFALIATTRLTERGLLKLLASLLLVAGIWPSLIYVVHTAVLGDPATAITSAKDQLWSYTTTFRGSNLVASWQANVEYWQLKAIQMVYQGKILNVAGMFVFGSYLGRFHFDAFLKSPNQYDRWWPLFAFVGLVGNGYLVWPLQATAAVTPLSKAFGGLVYVVATPALMLCYVLALSRLLRTRMSGLLTLLSLPGRLSLTTYLTHSVLLIALFYGSGVGPLPIIGPTYGLVLALALFAMQIVASKLWLQYHPQGPMETLWRRWVYNNRADHRRD